ncbi:hypothetical protein DL96DRAFT_1820213 [Flagelloscypha sp. PMI_526]|nr:hypothetical protein DL96DRAFT_1820213 [Flagelloscypha sp. PMI_526]
MSSKSRPLSHPGESVHPNDRTYYRWQNVPVRSRKSRGSSKKGCLTCKTRRVKCDEVHPVCTACSRRQEACAWSDDTDALLILPRVARLALKPSKDRQLSLPPLSDFRTQELELLHTWTSNTMFTFIPDVPVIRYGFQVTLPQFAFGNEFLLHATFAVTSLHMHHLLPSSNYLPLAKMHCHRAVLGVFNATKDSVPSEAIFMANILLAVYWLASPAWESGHLDVYPDVFDWIPASRKFMCRIGSFHRDMREGIVPAPSFLPPSIFSAKKPQPFEFAPFSDSFYQIYRPEVCQLDASELEDPHILAVYNLALRLVSKCCWSVFKDCEFHTSAIFPFLCTVSEEFVNLFLEKRPRAMILVAHFCAILGQCDGMWWYPWDRYRHDLQRILSFLDKKWLPCMEYPLNLMAMNRQVQDYSGNGLAESSSMAEASN